MRRYMLIFFIFILLITTGCMPKIRLFTDARDPLREYTLEGTGRDKILVIPVRGIIRDAPKKGFMRTRPGMVRQIVSHLQKAQKDDHIRAVLLKIDSPGGTVTASDLLYHEIAEFKRRTGIRIVAALMNVATSGGYYIALPADHILAHPTTVTGSVGVIFIRPVFAGLMEKLGLGVEVHKTGEHKDTGSPFRHMSPSERRMTQALVDELGQRFLTLVRKHRQPDPRTLEKIATARICLAREARSLGLVDQIGYLEDALRTAKSLAGLPPDARVVVYRRTKYPEDNLYNTASAAYDGGVPLTLVSPGLSGLAPPLGTGFYYLWHPGTQAD